jgi:hypothetical protein
MHLALKVDFYFTIFRCCTKSNHNYELCNKYPRLLSEDLVLSVQLFTERTFYLPMFRIDHKGQKRHHKTYGTLSENRKPKTSRTTSPNIYRPYHTRLISKITCYKLKSKKPKPKTYQEGKLRAKKSNRLFYLTLYAHSFFATK